MKPKWREYSWWPDSGYTPTFAGMVAFPEIWAKKSLRKRPSYVEKDEEYKIFFPVISR